MFPIIILKSPIGIEQLNEFKDNPYSSMIKYVVDIQREIVALGGEMHADSEKVLLENGSIQDHIWGANIYPWNNPFEIECTSLINIRPTLGNRSMEIQDEEIIQKVEEITLKWILIQ